MYIPIATRSIFSATYEGALVSGTYHDTYVVSIVYPQGCTVTLPHFFWFRPKTNIKQTTLPNLAPKRAKFAIHD
jgi:hypothetical protein